MPWLDFSTAEHKCYPEESHWTISSFKCEGLAAGQSVASLIPGQHVAELILQAHTVMGLDVEPHRQVSLNLTFIMFVCHSGQT